MVQQVQQGVTFSGNPGALIADSYRPPIYGMPGDTFESSAGNSGAQTPKLGFLGSFIDGLSKQLQSALTDIWMLPGLMWRQWATGNMEAAPAINSIDTTTPYGPPPSTDPNPFLAEKGVLALEGEAPYDPNQLPLPSV